MVMLDLGACPKNYLEIRSRIRFELVKVENSAISVGSEKFDIGVGMEFWKLE